MDHAAGLWYRSHSKAFSFASGTRTSNNIISTTHWNEGRKRNMVGRGGVRGDRRMGEAGWMGVVLATNPPLPVSSCRDALQRPCSFFHQPLNGRISRGSVPAIYSPGAWWWRGRERMRSLHGCIIRSLKMFAALRLCTQAVTNPIIIFL